MTIETQYSPAVSTPQPGDVYPFTFPSIGSEAIEVYEVDATGVRTFVSPNDYTLNLTGTLPIYEQGQVTFTRALDPGTAQVSVERNTPITQTVDLQRYSRFPADIIEFAWDKLTMICQELAYNKCDINDP